MLEEFLVHQKGVQHAEVQVSNVDAKIAAFDVFAAEAELMLHQLRDIESGYSRHRAELARGGVHVDARRRGSSWNWAKE
jgi:hypothetical protein